MKYIFFTISLTISTLGFGQNLVLNPSFEQYYKIPSPWGIPIDSFVLNWKGPIGHSGSPDYYHRLAEDTTIGGLFSSWGVPFNNGGFQDVDSGHAYSGIITYLKGEDLGFPDYREYLIGQLKESLEPSQCYKVSFKYSLSEKYSSHLVNSFGVYFSIFPPSYFGNPSNVNLNETPQIEINQYFSDSTNWVEITRFYSAQGGERYITLGNFKDNNNTQASSFNLSVIDGIKVIAPTSYVFIDDVSVVEMSPQSLPQVNLGNDTLVCGDNYTIDLKLPDSTIYVWNNMSNEEVLTIDSCGTYWLEAYRGCSYVSDSINVIILDSINSYIPSISADSFYCDKTEAILESPSSFWNKDSFLWNTGDTTQIIKVYENGIYKVEIENECFQATSSYNIKLEQLEEGVNDYNIFSPNDDGMNELFNIYEGDSEYYQIQIYNRWGKLVFISDDSTNHWKAEGVNDGTYFYYLSFRNCAGEIIEQKGTVDVKR